MEVLGNILGTIFIAIVHVYIWNRLLNKRINLKNSRLYIVISLLSCLSILNYIYINNFVKILTITIIMMPFVKYLFTNQTNKIMITPIMSEFTLIVSEVLLVIIIGIFHKQSILENYFVNFYINLAVGIIALILIRLPIINKINDLLLKVTSGLEQYKLIVYALIIMISANFLLAIVYYRVSISTLIALNAILLIVYGYILIRTISVNNQYLRIYKKYNSTVDTLKEYEDILDKYKVSNHENKNQLLMIRGMIKKKEKGIEEYIDDLVGNEIKDNEQLMFDTAIIPSGGLRGIVYSKLSYMKEHNIEIALNIDRKIRGTDLSTLSNEEILDICKITGVFLDNAIQEVENLEEKKISVTMYIELESRFCISVANNYESKIEIEKLDIMGYTTKSSGHGYGLSLVKEIVENNQRFENIRNISKEIFTQT